jgi:Flp pilus assembly protein CpaB
MEPVLVASQPLKRGAVVSAEDVAGFSSRNVPARYAPADAIESAEDAVGQRVQADISAGSYVTSSLLAGGSDAGDDFALRRGERAVTVEVLVSPAGRELAPGDSVDLYASGFGGDQRTERMIAGAEVLAVEDDQAGARPQATLRLASAQVAPVVRADVFAHELRAVLRP